LVSLPTVVGAQADAASPEGADWALTSFLVDDELMSVPIGVGPSLLLEAGTASGSGGCNTFNGGYVLDGAALVFDDALTLTLTSCPGDADEVEDAYLSQLTNTTGWAISGNALELIDESDDVILTFESPGAALTSSDLAILLARLDQMQADIDALGQRVDNISIARLRARIKALEADNERLKDQVTQLGRPAQSDSSGGPLNAAEKVLVTAVPARIASLCRPLRDRLPTGTAAAVQCSPNTSNVSEMAYYLMDKGTAVSLYDRNMRAQGLELLDELPPPGATGCWEGNPGYGYAPGGYIGGVGCYVKDGRANLRIIQEATFCKQLKVGGRQLKRPVMYVGITGPNADIQRVYDWAMRGKPNNLISGVVVPIENPNGRPSPTCGS
jgi:hypothetical protein